MSMQSPKGRIMMHRLHNMLRTVLTMALVAAVTLVGVASSFALDKVTLKDGTVLEGEITREMDDGTLFFTIVIGELRQPRVIMAGEIASVERDASIEERQRPGRERRVEIPDGATRVAFITLEEMVGPFFNTNALKESVRILDDLPENERPQIIVLWIDSGGGALIELTRIAPYIHEELKPKYRVVAWIKTAISAAAMTAWVCEEIYMMPGAAIGSNTAYMSGPGGTQAMEGEALEQLLIWMERVSEWGRKHPFVMRAMQVYMDLSADIDEQGRITWRDDLRGEHIVNTKNRILSMDSIQAVRFGIAQGVAQTKDELAKAMGLTEWVEVGHGADEYQQEFRSNVGTAQVRINELFARMNTAITAAGSAPNQREYDRQIAQALRFLNEIRSWLRRAPSLVEYTGLTPDVVREIEREIRDMTRGGSRGGGGGRPGL